MGRIFLHVPLTEDMKKLTLVRHAKSSWKDLALADFERPLNKRGINAAPLMGERLAGRGLRPGLILSSPATRAYTTARIIAGVVGYPEQDIRSDERIYEATAARLLDILTQLDDHYTDVMLVGHNPGLTDLANFFINHQIHNIPTCGVVRLDLGVQAWGDVHEDKASLEFFDYPGNRSA